MLNMEQIHEAIYKLENQCSTNYSNCLKLASLYIIRDHYVSNDDMKNSIPSYGNDSLDIIK